MAQQHYGNHRRLVPVWHFVGGPLLLAFLVCSVVYFFGGSDSPQLLRAMLLMAAALFILLFLYCRAFALKAQDRAIRAEEGLRYFQLTGKRIDVRVRMGQLIALRFASDEEMPALVDRAVRESLTQKQIKQLIVNWRGDYYRV